MDKILKQFGKEKIIEIVKISDSFVDATKKLGLNPNMGNIKKNVERCIKRLNISTEHFESVIRLRNSEKRWNKDLLIKIVNESNNLNEILIKLDILPINTNYNTLKKYLKRFNINYSHLKHQRIHAKNNWNEKRLKIIVIESKTRKEVLEKMELRAAGGNFKTLEKYLKLYSIDISHFTKSYDYISKLNKKNKIPFSDILVENSTYSRKNLKQRLYDEGLKEKKCELCGQNENWLGKKMSLILDHKNGIYNDNRIENLQIVCPNCNATLETYCRGNINLIKKSRCSSVG